MRYEKDEAKRIQVDDVALKILLEPRPIKLEHTVPGVLATIDDDGDHVALVIQFHPWPWISLWKASTRSSPISG